MGIIEIAPTRRFTSPFRTVFRPRPTGGINQPNKSATLRNRPIFHQFHRIWPQFSPEPGLYNLLTMPVMESAGAARSGCDKRGQRV